MNHLDIDIPPRSKYNQFLPITGGLIAQMVEQHTFNVRVLGSSPSELTTPFFLRPHRLAWPRTPPFHGGDGGSNPPGDAISFYSQF